VTNPIDSVRAEVFYVRNPRPEGADPLTFVTEDEERSTMVVRPGEEVALHDLRGTETSLDREGFVLVPHTSDVADFHAVEEDPAVDQRYVAEMEAFVGDLVGADRVLMLGPGKKRYGESAVDRLAGLANARPARYVHGDVTDVSGPELAAGMVHGTRGVDLDEFPRWAMYNVWRPITAPPQDFPLAVCDARTIDPADEVTVTAVTAMRGIGEVRFATSGYLPNPRHRWCWFSDMTPDEVLVFKTHDTDPARAHRVAHTAFTDPSCPEGTPTRASVEIRALALFR
jgi:hypothetical protein